MTFDEVQEAVKAFRDERDWAQFHNPKDLAISINLEASELLEIFQWSGSDLNVERKRNQLKEELADVMIYCILLADRINADIPLIISEKVQANAEKYPLEKARGVAEKYTEF